MNVFISYGAVFDQVIALRLQALAAVNGLAVFVPPAYTRSEPQSELDPGAHQKLVTADVILGIVGAGLSDACRLELNFGIAQHKHMIVMSYPQSAPILQPFFGSNLVVIDPAQPDYAERSIVERLKTMNAQRGANNALLALSTLALGLFILASAERS